MNTDTPSNKAFATIRGLLRAVGYDDCETDDDVKYGIESYADDYINEDLGMNLFVNLGEGDDGEGFSLRAKMSFYTDDAVNMWSLQCPVTIDQFHSYLDEFDARVVRLHAIVQLPSLAGADPVDDEEVPIVEVLSQLFGTTEAEVVRQLGDDWKGLESDVMGDASAPTRYLLWSERLVIGLDDEYVHLFTPVVENDQVDVGGVITYFSLGESETIGLTDFAQFVHRAVDVT